MVLNNITCWKDVKMEVKVFSSLPKCAKEIREEVFIKEQGFVHEFDDKDNIAIHLVVFSENNLPVATCRIFKDHYQDLYVLGRLAVIKEYRGKNLGSFLINEAEKYVKKQNGKGIILHAQKRIINFYKKAGFNEFGNVEYDEGCPHIWMKKIF